MGVWLPWLCVLGLLAATSGDQCHNSSCTQTNFREYTNCIQSSCSNNNNCQCSNVRCDSCQTSDQCCSRCCQNTINVQSSCNNNCQGNNCQSNCQSNNCQCSNVRCDSCQTSDRCCGSCCQNRIVQSSCNNNCQSNNCQSNCQSSNCETSTRSPPEKIRTCADINCRTCRGEECMGCCEYRTTTEQSGGRPQPLTQAPCNITNIFKPNITMPNITITVNQPPIHITTGPVLNNISVPCPNPGSLTCPTQNNTVIYVQPNSPNCCQIPTTRCIPSSNPVQPNCYNYQQTTCGAQCPYTSPPQYVPPPAPIYIPAPQPQYIRPPQPQYISVPQPQYIPVPQPQYVPPPPMYIPRYVQSAPTPCQTTGCHTAPAAPQYVPMPAPQCPASGCQQIPQPYYQPYAVLPPRQPCPWYGCQTPCVGPGCVGVDTGGYNPPTGSNIAAVPLPGAPTYPYYMPANYGTQNYLLPNGTYVVATGNPAPNPAFGLTHMDVNTKRRVGSKKSGGVEDSAEDDEENGERNTSE